MEITNGELKADLPDSLAQLLIKHKNWRKEDSSRAAAQEETATSSGEEPIPMTHIPGVVPGVTMTKITKLVASGAVPYTPKGTSKLVLPSDVLAALEKEKQGG